ncbi:MAG: hypothetical protein ACHBNF_20135 [Chromatiales bacterium]
MSDVPVGHPMRHENSNGLAEIAVNHGPADMVLYPCVGQPNTFPIRSPTMKLRFNKEVRQSVAEELKKISTYGGLGLGLLGYSQSNGAILLGAFVWWVICQTIAHLLLSIEDD